MPAGPYALSHSRFQVSGHPAGLCLRLTLPVQVPEPFLMPQQEESALIRRPGPGINQIAVDRPRIHARRCASEPAAASASQRALDRMLSFHKPPHDQIHGWINRKNVLRAAAGTTTWYC